MNIMTQDFEPASIFRYLKAIDWLTARLAEQSTWRGIFALLMSAGITIAPDSQAAIISLGMAAIGLINVVRKEKVGATIVTSAPVTITTPTTITTEPKGQ